MRLRNIALAVALASLSACAHNPKPLRSVAAEFGDVKRPQIIPLYIDTEIDRSGNDYHKRIEDFRLDPLRDRLVKALSVGDVMVEVQSLQVGVPAKVHYTNPFSIVDDSSKAQIILHLYVDGFRFSAEYSETQKMLGMPLSAPHGAGLQFGLLVQGVSVRSGSEVFQFNVDLHSGGEYAVTKKYDRDAAEEVLEVASDRIIKRLLKP